MKSFCVLLLPRQVQALFLLLCSCHMLLLLNIVKTPRSSTDSPGTSPSPAARVNGIAEESVKSSLRMGIDYKHFPRERAYYHSPGRKSHSTTTKQSVLPINYNSQGQNKGTYSNNEAASNAILKAAVNFLEVRNSSESYVRLKASHKTAMEGYGKADYNGSSQGATLFQSTAFNPFTDPSKSYQSASVRNQFEFAYLINQPDLCSQSEESNHSVHSIIIALSHPYNNAERDAIRDTWARYIRHHESPIQLRLVFILGTSDLVYSTQQQLNRVRREARLYKDVIVGDFNDTYKNLTLKSLFALQWVTQHCNQTRYVVKTDDDTFVNIDALRQFLAEDRNDSIIGALNTNGKVLRTGLWEVPLEQYPHDTYPPYCMGCIYVLSSHIIPLLLKSAKSLQLIPIEDTFITGILAQDNGYTCSNSKYFPEWHMSSSREYSCRLLRHDLIALHHVRYETMYKLQDIIKHGNTSNYCHSSA